MPLHHHLGGNAGMICAWLPECPPTLHALLADQDVSQGVLETVPHVEAAGDIGRRQHDAERFTVALGLKAAFLLPVAIPALLEAGRVIALFHGTAGRLMTIRGSMATSLPVTDR